MRSVSRLEPLTNLDQYRFFLVSSVPKKRRVSHDPASSFLSHLLISSILRERGTWCDDRWVGPLKWNRPRVAVAACKPTRSQSPVGELGGGGRGVMVQDIGILVGCIVGDVEAPGDHLVGRG